MTDESAGETPEVQRLFRSPDPDDVRVALAGLVSAGGSRSSDRLLALLRDPRPTVRADVLACLGDAPAEVAAAVRLSEDPDLRVAVAALAVVRRSGDAEQAARAGARLRMLASAPDASVRREVARSLVSPRPRRRARGDGPLVAYLCTDSDPLVRGAAIAAAASGAEPEFLRLVLAGLDDRRTASAAMAALPAFGVQLVPHMRAALATSDAVSISTRAVVTLRLVRVCAGVPETAQVLVEHMMHPDPDVQAAVLRALHRQRASGVDLGPSAERMAAAVMCDAWSHRQRCERVIETLDPGFCRPLRAAVHDEAEWCRELVMAARSLVEVSRPAPYEAAHEQAPTGNDRLGSHDRGPSSGGATFDLDSALRDLVIDPSGVWRRPWLRVLALHVIGDQRMQHLGDVVRVAAADPVADVADTATWAIARFATTA